MGETPDLAERMLRREVAEGLGVPAAEVRMRRLCGACGSSRHGAPQVSSEHGGRLPWVSLSRAGRLTVVAVTDAGPVGVDVEAEGAADRHGFDAVALHPEEAPSGRTTTWVRKESLLKATGLGLSMEPSRIRLTGAGEPPAVLAWDGPALPTVWMYDVETAPGHVAAVSVLADERPELIVRAEPEAPSPATRT